MADLLISPESYTTPGGVPRKLLAGVFLVVCLSAMTVFMLTSDDEPLMTGDQKARAELRKPESIAAQKASNGKWVDDAADLAHSDSERAARTRRLASQVLAVHEAGVSGAEATAGQVPVGPPALPAAKPALDAAAVDREMNSRSAPGTVFDEGQRDAVGTARSGADVLPDVVDRLTGVGSVASADLMKPIADAIRGQELPSSPPSRAEEQRAWGQQIMQASTSAGAGSVLRARPPSSEWMLHEGTVIPAVLTRRLNSDMPGVVTARVVMDVYDSRTSRRLLLPKGALLVGAYNHDIKAGQDRLQFAFTRLKMPDGSTFDLPGAGGADAAGRAGVPGEVNRRFLQRFGAALLIGMLADRVTKTTALPSGGPLGQGGGISATGQVFVDAARSELERHRAVPPTVTVYEGTRINVEVVRDMAFTTHQQGV